MGGHADESMIIIIIYGHPRTALRTSADDKNGFLKLMIIFFFKKVDHFLRKSCQLGNQDFDDKKVLISSKIGSVHPIGVFYPPRG